MPDSESLSADEERNLIAQLPDNPEAFRRLYRCYVPRIFAYVAARVGREQDAEDIVSDIFVKVVETIGKFEYRGKGSFAAWLFKIAHNDVMQFYRQHHRHTLIPLQELPDIQSTEPQPDDALHQKERAARLHEIINTLSPRRRNIIALRYFGGLRNHEIANVLGLDERTIASHLSRGLDDLQRKYQQKDVLT